VLEPRVENFPDAVELRAPEVLHLFEADVQMTAEVGKTSIVDEDLD